LSNLADAAAQNLRSGGESKVRFGQFSPGLTLAPIAGMLTNPADVNDLTRRIIGAGIDMHKEVGPGLLESTYQACFVMELQSAGLSFRTQVALPVIYKGVRLETGYRIDMLVEDQIVVEIKAIEAIAPVHRAQLLTYLKLGNSPVGLLLNFNVPVLKDGLVRIINSAVARNAIICRPGT
jgi:GxxExxY protein